MKARRRSGFTLIELLLVMAILAILATIVVVKTTGTTKDAKVKATKTSISSIANAIEQFEISASRYPTTEEGLNALVTRPSDVTEWRQSLDKVPADAWGNPFIYKAPGARNQNGFDLYSAGLDGREDTEDDIW